MKISKEDLELFKRYVLYDPATGEMTYLFLPFKKALIGSRLPKSSNPSSYKRIGLDGKIYYRHLIAFCLGNNCTIEDGYEVDHKDTDKSNDKLENLRLATRSQNMMNKKTYVNNALRQKCIYRTSTGKYRVACSKGRERYNLGTHVTLEAAVKIRDEKMKEIHGEFYNGGTECAYSL